MCQNCSRRESKQQYIHHCQSISEYCQSKEGNYSSIEDCQPVYEGVHELKKYLCLIEKSTYLFLLIQLFKDGNDKIWLIGTKKKSKSLSEINHKIPSLLTTTLRDQSIAIPNLLLTNRLNPFFIPIFTLNNWYLEVFPLHLYLLIFLLFLFLLDIVA